MLKIKVDGFPEAKQILDDLPNNLQKRMLLTALRRSAKPMLTAARNSVPVRSGKLKKQLRIIRDKDGQSNRSQVSVAVKPVFERTRKKGAINGFYGHMIHEGTTDRRKSKKGRFLSFENQSGQRVFVRSVKGLKSTPYLQTAFDTAGSRTAEIFGDELGKAVENYASKNLKPVK